MPLLDWFGRWRAWKTAGPWSSSVAVFERTCAALQLALLPHADVSALPQLLARLGQLYQGRLFGGAALEPWQVLARERQAMRFTRLVRDAGLYLETYQRWDEALGLYEQGLLQDLLAEPLHLALIRCLLALGRRAEARRALERCKAVLHADLGPAALLSTNTIGGYAGSTFTGIKIQDVISIFSYQGTLATPFQATAGTKYWISIVDPTEYARWYWTSGAGPDNVHTTIIDGTVYTGEAGDTAFTLHGSVGVVPEPASAMLFAIGAAGLLARSRRRA